MLKTALCEIRCAMDKLDAKRCDAVHDSKTACVLEQCDYYFTKIASVYHTPVNRHIRETYKELVNAFECAGFNSDCLKDPSDNAKDDAEMSAAISDIFPQFGSCPLENILHTSQDATMALLPYLLSSYYINLHKGRELSIQTQEMLFPGSTNSKDGITRDHNYSRNANVFIKRFSSENFLPDFFSAKRTGELKAIQELKAKKDVSEYLRKGPLSQFHYVQLFKAFVYLSCAAICSRVLSKSVNSKIDYKTSWELFDNHTLAFRTFYCDRDSWPDDDGEDIVVPFYSKALLVDPNWDNLIALHDHYLSCLQHLKIQEDYLQQITGRISSKHVLFSPYNIPHKKKQSEQLLYQGYAIMGSAIYNPLVHPQLRTAANLKNCLLRPQTQSSGTTSRYTMPYI